MSSGIELNAGASVWARFVINRDTFRAPYPGLPHQVLRCKRPCPMLSIRLIQ